MTNSTQGWDGFLSGFINTSGSLEATVELPGKIFLIVEGSLFTVSGGETLRGDIIVDGVDGELVMILIP